MIEYRRLSDGRTFRRARPSAYLDASPRYERVEPLSRNPAEERELCDYVPTPEMRGDTEGEAEGPADKEE